MLNNGVGSNGVACVRLVNQTKQSSRVYLWEYGITAISQHQHPPANILSSHPNQNTQTTHKIGGGDQTLSAPNESVSSRSGNVSKMLCVCLAFHVGMRKAGLFMAQLHYIKSHPAASLPRRHVEKKTKRWRELCVSESAESWYCAWMMLGLHTRSLSEEKP